MRYSAKTTPKGKYTKFSKGVDPNLKASFKHKEKMAKIQSPGYNKSRGSFGKTMRTRQITSAVKEVGREAFDDGNKYSANLGAAYLNGLINPGQNTNQTLDSTGQGADKSEIVKKAEALDSVIGSVNDLFGD